MTDNAIATIKAEDAALAAEAATKGDLAKLTPEQRTQLYGAVCRSVGLNPLTAPFQYIQLNGKLTLYAAKGATDQLRKVNGISITRIEKEVVGGVLMVTAYAQDKTGRTDSDIGAVPIANLQGEALANAHMKAITKAKRRVTLSIAGLGWLDESEIESIPDDRAQPIRVDLETGEIRDAPVARQEPRRATQSPTQDKSPRPLEANAQRANTRSEPDVLDQLPDDLKDAIAQWWKFEDFAAMPEAQKRNLRVLVKGEGKPVEKQTRFDQFVADFMNEDDGSEYGEPKVIEGEVVQNELIPDEDDVPTPAGYYTR